MCFFFLGGGGGRNSCQFFPKTRHWSMPNEVGLSCACSRKVTRLSEGCMENMENYLKKVLRYFKNCEE